MIEEIWMDIPGYEGRYQVSDLGRVRTVDGKVMGFETTQRGYYRVALYKNGTRQRFRVHRLVASVFVPNPNNLPQVDHINGDKTDNRACCLRWVSNEQNCNFDNKKEPKRGQVSVTAEDGSVRIFPSVKAASRAIGVSRYGIMAVLSGTQRTTANGMKISYIENPQGYLF